MIDYEGQVLENMKQIAINTTNISMIMKFGYIIIGGIFANVIVSISHLLTSRNGNGRRKK